MQTLFLAFIYYLQNKNGAAPKHDH